MHRVLRGSRIQRHLLGGLALSAIAYGASAQPPAMYQQTDYQGREIGQLTGEVYYARMDDYVSAFLVTPDGIVLVEPIGTEFATWLKTELDERFGVPVEYVIYSHHHADHGSGAAVFADTATIVGHKAMLPHLALPPAGTPLPDAMREMDANGNGRVEQREASGRVAALFDAYDEDEDGAISGPEGARGPFKYVMRPQLTYENQIDIHLGGKTVEVIPIPTDHADDNTVVRFVDGTNVVFASDWITIHRVPFGPAITLPSELQKIRRVEALEFEHFVCSHGRLGTKADVTANLRYREAVRDAVAVAIEDGQSLEQVRANVLMEDYADWEFYAQQRPLNVAGAYNIQTGRR